MSTEPSRYTFRRGTNANPGAVAKYSIATGRTPDQIAAAKVKSAQETQKKQEKKQEKAQKAAEVQAARDAGVEVVAAKEVEIAKKAKRADLEANHPPEKVSIPRKEPVQVNRREPQRRLSPAADAVTASKDNQNHTRDGKLHAARAPVPMDLDEESGPDNGDEDFRPESQESSETEDEEEKALKEKLAAVKAKKAASGGKREKKGVAARNEIEAVKAQIKRKASSDQEQDSPQPDARSARPQPKKPRADALDDNWETIVKPPRTNKKSNVLERRQSSPPASDFAGPATTDGGDTSEGPAFGAGGVSSDGEDTKMAPHLVGKTTKNLPAIAKTEDLEASILTRHARKSTAGKRPNTMELPNDTRPLFRRRVIPMLREMAGIINPFDSIPDCEYENMWNRAFPRYPCSREQPAKGEDEEEYSLFLVVRYLLRANYSTWLNRMAETGINAVKAEFDRLGLTEPEDKKAAATLYLNGSTSLANKTLPFLWKSYEDNGIETIEDGPKEGLFLHRLVASVFAEHLEMVSHIDPQDKITPPDGWAAGALMVSVQVVQRALLCFLPRGVFNQPGRDNAYSKQNYGDIQYRDEQGILRLEKRSTRFRAKIRELRKEHWEAIYARAQEFVAIRKRNVAAVRTPAVQKMAQESDSNDDELHDPAFDGGSHGKDQDVQMQAPDVGTNAGEGEGEVSVNANMSI